MVRSFTENRSPLLRSRCGLYAKAPLKFELLGEKLGGIGNLVKTQIPGKQQQWFLINHRDEFARCHLRASNRQNAKTKKPARRQVFQGFHGTRKLSVECKMVPEAGIEPARPYERGILSPMRLPVSPFGR